MKKTCVFMISFVIISVVALIAFGKQEETVSAQSITAEYESIITVLDQSKPYGFSENRAWVHNGSGDFLINTEGIILYAVPQHSDTNTRFTEFYPMKNGTAYFRGETWDGESTPVSVIVDAEGHEILRLSRDDDTTYNIIGHENNYFLVSAIKKLTTGIELYLLTLDNNGQLVGTISQINNTIGPDEEGFWGDIYTAKVTAKYLGENIYALGNYRDQLYGFYNSGNNTLQRFMMSDIYMSEIGMFTDGKLYVPDSTVFITVDDLQENRNNLTPTSEVTFPISWDSWFDHATQVGTWIQRFEGLCSFEGQLLDYPEGFEDPAFFVSDDGYVTLTDYEHDAFTVCDPSGNVLYPPKPQNNMRFEYFACNGLIEAHDAEYHLGVVDRSGEFHLYSDDLSGIDGLSNAYFNGFGCGYLIGYGRDLGMENESYMVIKSVETGTFITGITDTGNAISYGINDIPAFKTELSGNNSNAQTAVSTENTDRADDDIIYAASFKNVVLFDQDGVSLTMLDIMNYEAANVNEDNKKAEVWMSNILYDDIVYYRGTYGGGASLKSGESQSFFVGGLYDESDFWDMAGEYSPVLAELPLIEMTLQFYVQIGSDSEEVLYTKIVRLNSYSEEQLQPLYKDPVGVFPCGDGSYEIYVLRSVDNIAYAIKNLTGEDLFMAGSAGTLHGHGCWWIEGKQYGNDIAVDIPDGAVGIIQLGDIKDIWKEIEVKNNTPLSVSLELPMITMDLGIIE